MSIDIGILVVSEGTPSGNIKSEPSMADWLWFKPSTGRWHKHTDGSWEEVEVPSHLHPTLGDINFIGSISVGGVSGMDLDVTADIKKITRIVIKKGVITQFEYEV